MSLKTPALNLDYLMGTPLASLYLFAEMIASFLTNMAGKHGFGHGGAMGGGGQKAKTLIIIIILVLIIPFVALLFSGASTGAGGLYGNSTIGYAVRQSTYSFSQFIVLIMVLGALAIVLSLL